MCHSTGITIMTAIPRSPGQRPLGRAVAGRQS